MKDKKRTMDDVAAAAAAETGDGAEEQRKRAKKEAKRLKKQQQEHAAAVEVDAVAGNDGDEAAAARKAAKKAKKKAKIQQQEQEEEQQEPEKNTKSFTVAENKTKKEKKMNSNNSTNSSDFYVLHADTRAMLGTEAAALRAEKDITLTLSDGALEGGEDCRRHPLTDFQQLQPSLQGHCDYILEYVRKKNFTAPTPIQSQCWPLLLSGSDVVGIAATGSGKTLAFLVPGLLRTARLLKQQQQQQQQSGGGVQKRRQTPAPKILIVAPTRELAMQSHEVVQELQGPVRGVCVYGGVPKQAQRAALQEANAEVVVATPGRLMDLLDENSLSLSEVCYLVLDEADRMLDEGFAPAIRRIISLCPPPQQQQQQQQEQQQLLGSSSGSGNSSRNTSSGNSCTWGRQTVMFSATWPEEIRELAATYLRSDDLLRVTVGSAELSANHRVKQIVECVQAHEKDRKLLQLLQEYHHSRRNRILIFVLYKREAADLQQKLQRAGYNVTAIHGDKSQHERTAALAEFKAGEVPLLIATDVAARGLDIPQVEYVINYSFPLTVEDYVHRIGRTGRGGASGTSHTFFADFDKQLAGALVAVLQEAHQPVPPEIYQYPMVTKKKQSKMYGDFGPKADLMGKKATKITFD